MATAIVAALANLRERIVARITEVNAMTEREVLSAGASVHAIVVRANDHIGVIKQILSDMTDNPSGGGGSSYNPLTATIAEQARMLREYTTDLTARAATQDECSQSARAQSKVILTTADTIAKLAREARMLALNARIEASRASGGADGFAVIAAEMQRLANEVAAANLRVQDVAVQLGEILPVVADQAREIRTCVATFAAVSASKIADVEAGVARLRNEVANTLGANDLAIDAILRSSREAQSHLQFQDVAAQDLMQIDAWIRADQIEAAEAGGDAQAAAAVAPAMHVQIGGTQRAANAEDAGEVLLF